MRKAIRTLGVWVTEAAIAGAPMIPLFIFVTSFVEHEGSFAYVLPFVLFYAFNKAGEFTLGMFGPVENPYRIGQIASCVVIVGAAVCLLGEVSIVFYDIGAVLVGFGTSIFGTMYRTVKKIATDDGKFANHHADLVGFALMVVFASLILLAQGRLEEVIVASYVLMSVISLATLSSIGVDPSLKHARLFDYSKHDLKKGIPALCLLVIAFFARLFKQTANTTDVIVLFLLAAFVLVAIVVRGSYASMRRYEWHGVVFGEFLIFMVLYDVFYFIGQGDVVAVLIANLAMFGGQFVAMVFGKKIIAKLEGWKVANILLIATMASAALFLIPPCNFPSMLLMSFFTKIGFMRVNGLYHVDENDLSVAAINLGSQKVVGIGIVAGQTILVVVLALVSFIMLHDTSAAMASYALRVFSSDLSPVFHVTQIVCDCIFLLQGVALLAVEKVQTGSVLRSDGKKQGTSAKPAKPC